MASSYAADIPTQVSQFRPATFQPGPAGPYRNPSSAPPNVVGASSTSRPRSIAEMAEMAKDSLGDGDFPFKTWLRIAENARRSAKTYRERDELESAFVEYAKAAIISLEKIPGHPDYTIRLNSTQRHDMNLSGQEMLDSLADIKITIINRYERWQANHSSVQAQSQYSPASNLSTQSLLQRRSVYSHETNTLSLFTARSHVSMLSRTHHLSPYGQSLHEGDNMTVQHEGLDAILRDVPRPREEANSADGARPHEFGAHGLRGREEEGQRRTTENPQEEQDSSSSSTLMPFVPSPIIPGSVTSAPSASGQSTASDPTRRPTRSPREEPNRIFLPVTTTSAPPANLSTIQYPSMMNEHQVSRGYHGSMLYRPSTSSHSGPLNGSDPVARELKRVSFPRDCLNRFLSIASIDTHPYRETCGMLLGEYKGGRYIVTTLLVPKQHVTDGSDSCEMDEEELVVQFVEEHSLFTLGWIRTHPFPSCYMTSSDMHSLSGSQKMLPESFAVVCSPSSTPRHSFGIFRLTDPGLRMILECTATKRFHPHPEDWIYTDASKGHVEIKDLPLEIDIVDLR